MGWATEQMFYGVWCHSTPQTNIWYATEDAAVVQQPTLTRTQLGKCGTDRQRQQL